MNREAMQGSWSQIKGDVQSKWAKLTHDDLELAKGKFETLASSLQRRYDFAKDKAEQELDAFIKTIDLSKLAKGSDAKSGDKLKAAETVVATATKSTSATAANPKT